MSIRRRIAIAFEDFEGGKGEAIYTDQDLGPEMSLLEAFKRFEADHPTLGPKNIRGAHFGDQKKPFSPIFLREVMKGAFRLPPREIVFLVSAEDSSEIYFHCPKCAEKLFLWDYLNPRQLNLYWEIIGPLTIVCPKCGTELGEGVKTALNGVASICGEVFMTGSREPEEAFRRTYSFFLLSFKVQWEKLKGDFGRQTEALARKYGVFFSACQTHKEIGEDLSPPASAGRVGQMCKTSLRRLRHPARCLC